MAKHSRLKVVTTMIETGLVPVFYVEDPEVASHIVSACLQGGARCIEFTNRRRCPPGICRTHHALQRQPGIDPWSRVNHRPLHRRPVRPVGANFIVGPSLSPEMARLCNRRKVAYCPGCGSVTEISQAEELGAELCKVFPSEEVGGPEFIRSVRGPMPWVRLMPTGGVSPEKENILAWIRAGAAALGIGSTLILARLVAAGDYQAITASFRRVLAWIQEACKGASVI